MPLGLYISVPFCRTKCTYCNFASDVFSRAMFDRYVARLCAEIEHAPKTARRAGGSFDPAVDTIYFGGGTPTLLNVCQLDRVFVNVRQNFTVHSEAEITVECAPGTLSDAMIECFVRNNVNRVSLGVQSFVDQEARSVGRLHDRQTVLNDIARLRSAGISNINVDLIAGLPHQTIESWQQSLDDLIATGVPHASVYMLEVDEDSRLGRELIAGGQKYHAHFVPDEDLTADMYELACEKLDHAGIEQYEISNFACAGFESKHNLKYWRRQPYLGFGVDAHSMLNAHVGTAGAQNAFYDQQNREGHNFQSCRTQPGPTDGTAESRALPAIADRFDLDPAAIRLSNPENLDEYLQCAPSKLTSVSREAALQETYFLGLRLTTGVSMQDITDQFGNQSAASTIISDCVRDGLMEQEADFIRLTARGRLLSNEVFERFLAPMPLSAAL